jgi:DNA-binding NtrC family response regulator
MKSRKSALVIDDDFALRGYLFAFLTSGGLDVVTAESGEEALSRLKSGYTPSIVILDMYLPGMGIVRFGSDENGRGCHAGRRRRFPHEADKRRRIVSRDSPCL